MSKGGGREGPARGQTSVSWVDRGDRAGVPPAFSSSLRPSCPLGPSACIPTLSCAPPPFSLLGPPAPPGLSPPRPPTHWVPSPLPGPWKPFAGSPGRTHLLTPGQSLGTPPRPAEPSWGGLGCAVFKYFFFFAFFGSMGVYVFPLQWCFCPKTVCTPHSLASPLSSPLSHPSCGCKWTHPGPLGHSNLPTPAPRDHHTLLLTPFTALWQLLDPRHPRFLGSPNTPHFPLWKTGRPRAPGPSGSRLHGSAALRGRGAARGHPGQRGHPSWGPQPRAGWPPHASDAAESATTKVKNASPYCVSPPPHFPG